MTEPASSSNQGRSLPIIGFLGIAIVYLAIIQGGGILAQKAAGVEGNDLLTIDHVIVGMWIPLGVALAFTYGVITWLGWLRPVLHDDRPVARWVVVVPIVFVVAILIAIDYSDLSSKGIGYILVLLVACQLVGWGEEGMFRGLGVVTLRRHGMTEGKVALWSSLIFGSVHLSNAISRGAGAISQAIIVSLAGYFFYLIRRVSHGNVVNSILHGLFDFSILTGTAILADQTGYAGTVAPILLYVVLAVILLVRRHRIEVSPAAASA